MKRIKDLFEWLLWELEDWIQLIYAWPTDEPVQFAGVVISLVSIVLSLLSMYISATILR